MKRQRQDQRHPTQVTERLAGGSPAPGSKQELAAIYLRSAVRIPELGPAALARVSARLSAGASPDPGRAPLRWKTILAVITIGVGAGGATGAAVWVVAPRIAARRAARPARPQAPPAFTAPATPPTRTRPPAAPEAPESDPPAAPAQSGRIIARVEAAHVPREALPPSTAPSTAPAGSEELAREAELVGVALRRLRRDDDPRAALAALDEHAARFGDGVLRPEADVARVEALLALDRRPQALAVLDRVAISDNARGRELAIVRAELRAGSGRCPEAVVDFSRALADPALDGALAERALHGRAACHVSTGNRPAAKLDLDAYLLRFPTGRYAAESRRALAEIAAGTVERNPPPRVTGADGRTQ